jgi:dihydroxyacetone kinase-like predicted kinase
MELVLYLSIAFLFIVFLSFIDSKIDYRNKHIYYNIYNDNGTTFIRVPYLIWQQNKRKAIEEIFSEFVEYEGRLYNVIIAFKNQTHISEKDNVIMSLIYRDYYAEIELFKSKEPNIVINTQIEGNNNTVNIVQNITNNISESIDSLLNDKQIAFEDKKDLELFKYKLKANETSSNDANKIIDKLTKYTPHITLANTLITLIKTLYSLF